MVLPAEDTTMSDERLAETFVELADTLVDDFDLIEFWHRLVERCAALLDVDAAGLLIADLHGELALVAATSEPARMLEQLALHTDEGPHRECWSTGQAVNHPDLVTARDRWPQFTVAATQAGFAAVSALPMRLRTEVIGTMTLFLAAPGGLSPHAQRIAQALADVATIGVLQHRSIHHREMMIDQLQTALTSRVIIEQVKGVLSERLGIDLDTAFTLLRRHARHHGRRLGDVAAAVLDGTLPSADLTELTPPDPPEPATGR
jgi:transcriptional regulator with GAF, ATPase, and Fis domain